MARSKEITHKIMSSIKSKNTKPERLLGSAMWKLGLRYRKHYKILGKPDFVFIKYKIAVFVDGDFWHGNNWKIRGMKSFEEELNSYSQYWREKITKNIERDKKVTQELENINFTVLRFWESDIKNNVENIAILIKNAIIDKQ